MGSVALWTAVVLNQMALLLMVLVAAVFPPIKIPVVLFLMLLQVMLNRGEEPLPVKIIPWVRLIIWLLVILVLLQLAALIPTPDLPDKDLVRSPYPLVMLTQVFRSTDVQRFPHMDPFGS